MREHNMADLHNEVKQYPLREIRSHRPEICESVSRALNCACAFYPREALCLQRSVVLVKMLRKRGLPAKMIIGAQQLPFRAHAWVEVSGEVIDDRLVSRESFLVLEVC
ncbi:lasso peptide biosynthesis B2 protein [Acidicapsa ligni]|uniref:lasso peptide biosynthesis B2 protein n=1 Tax=Acidicapsa ligni TaxID=542300 RepID=UPI0037C0F7AF